MSTTTIPQYFATTASADFCCLTTWNLQPRKQKTGGPKLSHLFPSQVSIWRSSYSIRTRLRKTEREILRWTIPNKHSSSINLFLFPQNHQLDSCPGSQIFLGAFCPFSLFQSATQTGCRPPRVTASGTQMRTTPKLCFCCRILSHVDFMPVSAESTRNERRLLIRISEAS